MCSTSLGDEAKPWSRDGTEIYFIGQTSGSNTVSYNGTTDEIDGFTAYGLGLGANEGHLGMNLEFLFGSTSDTWNGVAKYDADIWFLNFNLDWNILKARLTPVITGGVGLLGMDGRNGDGSPYDETTFSCNLGAGLRWDITDNIAVKVLYRSTWAGFDYADEWNQFDGVTASIAYVFK